MPVKLSRIKGFSESVKRAGRVYGFMWISRIEHAIDHILSMRRLYGFKHEGEAGLLITKFIKETFKGVSTVNKVSKLCNSSIGKTYIAYTLLDLTRKFDKSKVSDVLNDIKGLRNKSGLRFFEGIMNIIDKHFDGDVKKNIGKLLGMRVSNVLIGDEAVYDPISGKLVARDEFSGKIFIESLDIKDPEELDDLLSYGIRSKDMFADYAEWKMLRIIEDAKVKGFEKEELGFYVFRRLREELQKDDLFEECLKYYLAKHLENLKRSEMVAAAFGELFVQSSKIYRRLMVAAARAASMIPIFGSMVEGLIAMGEGVGGLGEGLAESLKKSKEKGIKTVKVELGRQDDLFRLF